MTFALAMVVPTALLVGFRFVGTASVPQGLWFVHQGSLSRGAYALVCLPLDVARLGRRAGYLPSGHCPGNVLPLMKHVVALPGDRVTVEADGVRVNGTLLARSRPLTHDSEGKIIVGRTPRKTETVAAGTIWVLGDSSKSWDSRYYGAIPEARVLGLGTPVLTSPAGL